MENTRNHKGMINEHWLKVLICFLIVSSLALIYSQVTSFGFVNFDDPIYVKTNQGIIHGVTFDGIIWAFRYVYASNWHPLTWISHMLDIELFGMNPGMHHLTNVVFHILNSILLFLLFQRMTGAPWRSGAVAALFALHPMHVESVAWISERKDVLSTFFWMLTMLSYYWYSRSCTLWRYLLVAMLFGLGLMAKPMLVTLPFVLLLLDFWPLRRNELNPHSKLLPNGNTDVLNDPSRIPSPPGRGRGQSEGGVPMLVLEKVPLMLMALIASGVTFYAQSIGGALSSLGRMNPAARAENAFTSYTVYLWKMIWPLHLAAFYPYPKHFSVMAVAACLTFLISATLVVLKTARRLPYLAMGWLWYLGTLVPVIGIVQVGSQAMADRYTYIPFIGVFVIIVWGLTDLVGKTPLARTALGTIMIAVLVLSGWFSWIQVGTWKNSETLFRHALVVTPDSYLAHGSLGIALFDRGDTEGAIKHFNESLRLMPNYVNAHCNLGMALVSKKQYPEAFAHYRECLRIKPGYSEAYYNMGVALSDLGRKDEAITCYKEVLTRYPYHENAHNNLGLLLTEKGHLNEAVYHFRKAIESNPDNIRSRLNLSDALLKQGRLDEALFRINEALKVDPNNPGLYTCIGNIYTRKNDREKAGDAYIKASKIVSGYSEAK
jgi:protein O-mannosyl-transferase